MSSDSLSIEEILARLAKHPARIAELCDGLTATKLRIHPDLGEWSANDVLAHLRSCADVWGGCIRLILSEDKPTIRAVNPRTWSKQTNYPELEFSTSFDTFTAQRADLLALLESLPVAVWSRMANVMGVGRPIERSIQDYAARLVIHERPHIKQIERILNTSRKS